MVSPAFQDRKRNACVPSDSQAERLHFRIAGVSPASGCTQPLMSEFNISSAFLFAFRQSAGGTPAIRWSRLHFRIASETPVFLQIRRRNACVPSDSQAKRLHFRIAGVSPACGCTQPLMSEFNIATAFLFAFRQSAGGTPAICWSVDRFKNDPQIRKIFLILRDKWDNFCNDKYLSLAGQVGQICSVTINLSSIPYLLSLKISRTITKLLLRFLFW
ncbi:MAG: hypothetical protein LBP59_19925 [Planctomycetaceae bacterium]|nr:hypothetical protein [Planctomycetaceae bacterium]